MELRHLRYFIAVAEELNVTRAAQRLHTSQPSLSQQIRGLEQMVGAPLFRREKHHLQLTEAGRIFLEKSRAILSDLDIAVESARKASNAEAGRLTLGMMPGAEGKLFGTVVADLVHNYKDIRVSLRTLSSPDQITALQKREINIGFLRGPITDEQLDCEVFANEKILVILPAQHPLAQMEKIPVPMLAAMPLIRVNRAIAPTVYDAVSMIGARADVQFRSPFETENVLAVLNAVAAGLGFSLLPEYVLEILPPAVIARQLDLDPAPKIDLFAAYRKDDRLPALAFFLSLLHEMKSHEHA